MVMGSSAKRELQSRRHLLATETLTKKLCIQSLITACHVLGTLKTAIHNEYYELGAWELMQVDASLDATQVSKIYW